MLLAASERAKTYRTGEGVVGIVDLDPTYFASATPNAPWPFCWKEPSGPTSPLLPDTLRNSEDFAFRETVRPRPWRSLPTETSHETSFAQTENPAPATTEMPAVVYDNKEFLLNAINHLLQEGDLISVRSRTITLRSLDERRVVEERQGWQFVAVGMPLLLVVPGSRGADHQSPSVRQASDSINP